MARNLVAMVDGFATAGPRHWRARAARNRREAWLGDVVPRVRAGEVAARSPLWSCSTSSPDGRGLLVRRLRGHALHRWREHRERLNSGDVAYAEAFTHELRRFYRSRRSSAATR